MKKLMTTALLSLAASPAFAASGPFFSLGNTNFIVTLGFLVFIGVLFYFKVPGMIGGLLDRRAETIKSELDEAKALREEAQSLLASYERKQKEVQEQADRIVATAKDEAAAAAEAAKAEIKASVARRLAAAEDQIASAETAAVREIRDRAVSVAIEVARDVLAGQMTATQGNKLIDEAIATVETKLH
ncbi:F0F1 ATP synthase subunit B [Loktanella sp. IMCC34160]|uniref:F0F1 ATP synthase subunit B n=1 Tax=Loktanella sp. IMCC34160 TaxID=2510646 RepID=UPI00101D2009|nr:F0F1 ATP synthase subunit B [Loktanella sp. IMCC34160]RYG92823.1 F0F1 ATP synthase subunit B [Loktanella sp. IMCC34160]